MTQDRRATAPAPTWVWPVLLFGAALTLYWAWFIIGFLSEPSAVGRVRIVLLTSTASSVVAALVGVIGAIGLVRRERWARTLAAVAAAAMTLTGVGAIAGIPALIGLFSSRNSSRN
jgi:hypothetical protein